MKNVSSSSSRSNDGGEKGGYKGEVVDLENPMLSVLSDYEKTTLKAVAGTHISKVSFNESELVQRHISEDRKHEDQVLKCTSNGSFQHKGKSGLMRLKTKSRLMDLVITEERRTSRIENHSRMLGRNVDNNIEEDDPFDDDLPEEYKKGKIKMSFFNIVHWGCLILIVVALVCSLTIKELKGKTLWHMKIWKWEVMGLVLICGGLVTGWLIRIVVFFIERNFLFRKRVLYFVYGLRSSVHRFLWLGWLLLAWILILDKKVGEETNSHVLPYVSRILFGFIVTTLLWLVKTLLVKVLAMNFHVSAFFDRIQAALFNQYVIKKLSGPSYLELPADSKASCLGDEGRAFEKSTRTSILGKGSSQFAKSSSNKRKGGKACISIDHLHRLTEKNVSAWNMKRLMSIVRKGVLSTLDDHLDPTMEEDRALQIRSEKEANVAAKKVFNNVARPGSRHIYSEDLERFLREDEASITMDLFEGAGDGQGINKHALKNWVVNVFRERRALAFSLNDTKTAIHKLHQLVNILVGGVVLIIWLMILGLPIAHFLVFMGSQVIVLAFIFSNTCKTTFEAIIFLFVMHPFDVGDRCEIEGVQMVVEEMNILTTVFLKFDNQKVIYPNSVLATKPISNYYRSPHMGDAIDFCVHISTPMEKISLMKEGITSYIDNKKEHWSRPLIVMRDVEDMNRIKFSIWLSHTMNYQDMGERWVRRAILVEVMIKIFRDLDIEYRMLPMDVNVRNMSALVSERLPSNWTTCAK